MSTVDFSGLRRTTFSIWTACTVSAGKATENDEPDRQVSEAAYQQMRGGNITSLPHQCRLDSVGVYELWLYEL